MSNLKFILLLLLAVQASAQTINITGPAGSGQFGKTVTVLTNGNYVIIDPLYDDGVIADVGAVYLYNGNNHTLLSTLKGSTAGDSIASGGIMKLTNGNYVILSPKWDNGTAINAGAATWSNGVTGISGIISSGNSVVGSTSYDRVGYNLASLNNGNYVVLSQYWTNGSATAAGAATWGNGSSGTAGIVSTSNSLVGSTTNDNVGLGIGILTNGNYIVKSQYWNNGLAASAGAVTWGNGSTGIAGMVSSANSLVGSSANDLVGGGLTVLSNGNYVVNAPFWNNGSVSDAGAVTWGSGTTGVYGVINSSNSLVGIATNDLVGIGLAALTGNGNYVVISYAWNNGLAIDAGAVTWANGNIGVYGVINSSNSLIGSYSSEVVGYFGVKLLSNGNYVVCNPNWNSGTRTGAGAVTWCSGTAGNYGYVGSFNSLVGSNSNDHVGDGITLLTNGNYVVKSPRCNNISVEDAGAATWCNGSTGKLGVVSVSNSLMGTTFADQVGSNIIPLSNGKYLVISPTFDHRGVVTHCANTGITGAISNSNSLIGRAGDGVGSGGAIELTNGNYVIISPDWDNPAAYNAGAVTWANGNTGITGSITSSNSLIGTKIDDSIGKAGVRALSNGNYVVVSPSCDNGTIINAGAVTWANGATGISGVVNFSNSLLGNATRDNVGYNGVTPLSNGNYVIQSPYYSNGVGAATWANGTTGISGFVNTTNSLIGTTPNDRVGSQIITLINGNYVVASPNWSNGPIINAGAATWVDGSFGISGYVSPGNSLVGSTANDFVGAGASQFGNNYFVRSSNWDNGSITDAGAITVGSVNSGVSGIIVNCNSIVGTIASGGASMNSEYNPVHDNLIVGRPAENIVSIYNPSGMAVASAQDSVTVTINGTSAIPLITSNGCHIIATLTPNGVSPVNGPLKAKVWVEPAVPVYVDDPFVSRHYEITPAANAATATGRITLYFTQQEFDDFNNHAGSVLNLPNNDGDAMGIANLRVGKYAGSSNNNSGLPGTYAGAPSIIDPNDTDVVWNSNLNRWEISFEVTGFSGFVVQTKATALPLQLLNFSAMLVQNDAVLTWKTTGETNTQNFEVLRSTDGRSFTKVGTVAAINNPIDQTYNYTDAGAGLLKASKLYYRLKLVDKDGSYNNSLIVMLHLSKNNHVTVYPNPVNNITVLSFSNSSLIGTIAVLTDMLGKKLQQFTISNYQQPVNMSQLATGMYILKLKDGTTVKLIKN